VRIDQTYRGIVLKPDVSPVDVLLWVDHHDKAYQWAKNRVCDIHPETGAIQVVEVVESREEVTAPPAGGAIQVARKDGCQRRMRRKPWSWLRRSGRLN